MKRVLLGSVLLAAVGLLGCRDNPIEADGTPAKIVASPSRVFISQAGSENVTIQVLDAQGNPLPDEITVSAQPAAGVTVARDEALRPTYAPDGTLVPLPEGTVARFIVSATEFVKTSFTVTSGGVSLEVPVEVVPATLPATLSKTDLSWGDTITITAPAGTFFRDTSRVTFAGGIAPIIVDRAADGSSIRLVPGPNTSGAATVTSVGISSNPGLFFTVPTVAEVTAPSLADLGTALSTTTPTLGQTITLTAPAGVKFFPTASVYFLSPADVAKQIVIAPDSSSISFIAPPNRKGAVSVTQVAPGALPQASFRQTLTTTDTIQTPVVAAVAGTFSTITPEIGDAVTFTAGPGFKVTRSSLVDIGGASATVISAAADSSSITFLAPPGGAGLVRITNAVAGGFALSENLPTPTTSFAVGTSTAGISANPATLDPTTAPTFTVPASVGWSNQIFEKFVVGEVDQFYKITTTAANTVLNFQLAWPNTADIDLLVCTTSACSAFLPGGTAGATGANPENATAVTIATPGTYYVLVELFAGAEPAFYSLRMTRTQ